MYVDTLGTDWMFSISVHDDSILCSGSSTDFMHNLYVQAKRWSAERRVTVFGGASSRDGCFKTEPVEHERGVAAIEIYRHDLIMDSSSLIHGFLDELTSATVEARLIRVNFDGYEFADEIGVDIAKALEKCTFVEHINLSNNYFGILTARALAGSSFPKLVTLDLHCAFHFHGESDADLSEGDDEIQQINWRMRVECWDIILAGTWPALEEIRVDRSILLRGRRWPTTEWFVDGGRERWPSLFSVFHAGRRFTHLLSEVSDGVGGFAFVYE